jgi:hypothetical protein
MISCLYWGDINNLVSKPVDVRNAGSNPTLNYFHDHDSRISNIK